MSVERIAASSLAAWDEGAFGWEAPVVVSGSVDARALREEWSPEALRARAGGREVSVARADAQTFGYAPGGEPLYTRLTLPFADALGLIARARPPGPVSALRRAELSKLGLSGDGLPGGAILDADGAGGTRGLWVGSESSVTPLHYDTRNNLLTQLHGRKAVTLFPASERERIYPAPFTGTNLVSRVDPEAVDPQLFPDFPAALALRVEIGPGDTLFIPPFWWHHVRSLDFTVSANLFWRARPAQWLVENSVEFLRVQYRRGALEETLARAGPTAPLEAARLATSAGERGLGVVATLLAAACLRLALRGLADARRAADDSADDDADRLVRALTEAGVLDAAEGRRARQWVFLGDLAAQTGRAPKASELESLLAGVSALVSRHPAWTNTPACAPIN